jgi:transposase InsO family protein
MIEKETGNCIQILWTDRGGDFLSKEFNSYCKSNGIQRQLTQAMTLQQNEVAKQCNMTLVEKARSMVASSGISPFL